jgi:diguanylate cyclase (GGDEF)-like protein
VEPPAQPADHAWEAALWARCLRESRLGFMDMAAEIATTLIGGERPGARAELRLDARIRLIWIQFQNGQHEEARLTAEVAVREALALGDRGRESRARSWHARVLCEGQDGSGAADEAIAALRLARSAGDPLALSVALVVPAIICSRLNLYEAAVEMVHQAVKQADLSGDAETLAHAISNYGSLHADYLYRFAVVSPEQKRAYLDIAIAESLRATTLARDNEDSEMQRLSGYNLVEFRLLARDLAGAEEAMRLTDAAIGVRSRRSEVQRGHVNALLMLEHSDPGVAIAALRDSVERCIAYPFTELAVFASGHLSRVLAENGAFEAAYREHRRFHALYCEHNSEVHSRHMQSSIILDQIGEMSGLVAAESARAERLEALNAALALETERLARETLEDPLTGLANRRQLDLFFAGLAARDTPHAVALIDVDRFKRVNDQFSHVIGDAVLRVVATILQATLATATLGMPPSRDGGWGLAARLGGEEFAIALVTSDTAKAQDLCEDLRQCIANYDWERIAPGLAITVSIGLAMSPEASDTTGRLAIADLRLYDAKHLGRNRSVFDDGFRTDRPSGQ